jgi:3',5'-cyclic AMP phosphodiesterase CpdA
MKKYLIALIISISLGTLAAFGFFLMRTGALNALKPSPSSAEQLNHPAPQIKSFQGVLKSALEQIQQKAEDTAAVITAAVPNPFADRSSSIASKSTPAENKTAPTDGSFIFAILGDTQRFNPNNPTGNFQKAMTSVKKLNPDMIFAVGDLLGSCDNYSKCGKGYSNWKNVVGSLMPKTYAAQGNHDRTGGNKADTIWQTAFNFPTNGPAGYSELTYSFDYKNSHFIVLASDKPTMHQINEEQRAWLEKDLAANKKDDTFVFFHEPAFPVSSKVGESLDKHAAERDALWQIFDKYNVTGVFNGHEHIVSRRKIDSSVFSGAKNTIYQFVFGDTDSFDHALPAPGIVEYAHREQGCFGLVKVSGKEITIEAHGPDGALLDSFAFSK